jgi:hypothetical protein
VQTAGTVTLKVRCEGGSPIRNETASTSFAITA